ncbi:MAG TPA: NADH-quinone oxidoreductase subunit NuoH [Geobacteraceae bacterium]|nr:NADH-quinone oxidoreductase subunit NuoH [Geobacteraceae bacterium]
MGYELFGLPLFYYFAMFAKVITVFVFLILTVAYATYAERKIIGHMQIRLGPMRTGWHGLLQPIADGIKLFFKEEIAPLQVSKFVFFLAPFMALVPAYAAFAVIPFGDTIEISGYKIPLQIAAYYDPVLGKVEDVNVGVLYVLAMSSLGVYGIVLAGWASNSKYSLLGGLRSAAQMISYELAASFALVAVFMLSESLSLHKIVADQAGLFGWYIWKQPLAFILFCICSVAETNRTPFDLPEAENELVAGFSTEYSSMKYAMFFMAEYANMVTVSAVATTFFLGGWHGPFPSVINFIVKVYFFMFCFIWIRATYPRYRYDQLMRLGWKVFLPLALINVVVTAVAIVL